MIEPRHCPTCGTPLTAGIEPGPDGSASSGPSPPAGLPSDAPPLELAGPDLPPGSLLASGSTDDAFVNTPMGRQLAGAEPEPTRGPSVRSTVCVLGEIVDRPPTPAVPPIAREGIPLVPGDAPKLPIDINAPTDHVPDETSVEVETEVEERGTPWATVLLSSYASALTLALGWTLWKERARADRPDDAPPTVVASLASARQRDLSRKVQPPEPILGEHFATLGQPLRVGSLEIIPVAVGRGPVLLQRPNLVVEAERREGGKDALLLRLKLRNVSADSAFAPLDEAYLRERGREIVDTFVEAADGGRIYPFRLALESEWSVVGQSFRELRPGESSEVTIVTAPDAPADSEGPFTWRVRLRTGVDRTDTIGLRWSPSPATPTGPPKAHR